MDFRAFLEQEQQELMPIGKLPTILGTGESEKLSFGSAPHFKKPFLYVPLGERGTTAQALKAIRRKAEKQNRALVCVPHPKKKFHCHPIFPKKLGPTGEILEDPYEDIGKENRAKFASVGEMHLTVAYGDELEEAKSQLIAKYGLPPESSMKNVLANVKFPDDPEYGIYKDHPLFTYPEEGGVGVRCPVYYEDPDVKPQFVVANTYTIPRVGNLPPIAMIVPVQSNMVLRIRDLLGLEKPRYRLHVTLGYVIPTQKESSPKRLTTLGRQKGEPTAVGQLHPGRLQN